MFGMKQKSPQTSARLRTSSGALLCGPRWSITSAVFGGALWLVAPFIPNGTRPSVGSIEHTFLFLPLVAAPLALLLVSVLLDPVASPKAFVLRAARGAQPVAAAMLLASFFVPKGTLAGALCAGWLLVTVFLALGETRRSLKLSGEGHLANASLLAAHVFLPIGAVWLLMSRLGIAPPGFAQLTVFLAALHFHFGGFLLQLLIAATGLRLAGSGSRWTAVHRGTAIGALTGILIIAAGNLIHAPFLKFLGVSAMVVSTIGLAVTSTVVALQVLPSRPSRLLLLTSASSIATAMTLAGVYGVGELTGRSFIGIPHMAAIHGLLNAVGFSLCGLLGHLLVPRADRTS